MTNRLDNARQQSHRLASTERNCARRARLVRGRVVTAAGVLRSRLDQRWTLDALAEEVHLSRSQLARCFDATTGLSPMAFLRKMRVKRTARLLASTDLSIAEAARTVGWTDPNCASRTFHDCYGVSPTDFRGPHSAPPIG